MPEFSILIPHYNDSVSLKRLVESIVASSVVDMEVVIYDDGSSAEHKGALEHILDFDKRIKIKFADINLGAGAAFNWLYEHAEGKYLVVSGSDDLVHPKRLIYAKECYEIPENRGKLLVSSCDTLDIDYNLIQTSSPLPDESYINQLLYLFQPFIGGTLVIEKEKYMTLKPFRKLIRSGSDYVFFAENNDSIEFICDRRKSHYMRIRSGSITRTSKSRKMQLQSHTLGIYIQWKKILEDLNLHEAELVRRRFVCNDDYDDQLSQKEIKYANDLLQKLVDQRPDLYLLRERLSK